jgi:hypothetical protein
MRAIAWLVAVGLILTGGRARAAELQEAQVTVLIKDVQLLPSQAAARAAALNEKVRQGTAVRTGPDSRTELTFTDQTIARMGQNTLFSFDAGTRNINLGSGVMLVHVPKGSGGAKITTAGVTAGVTGTTLMVEYHKRAPAKLIVLEGAVRMWLTLNPAELQVLHAGQMLVVPPNATKLPEPETVDLEKLMNSALLVTEFPPLPSLALIAAEIAKQQAGGPWESERDPTNIDDISQAIAAIPPAGAGGPPNIVEFGPLNTIVSPTPYVINSTTRIRTAPTIRTNGVTDQGKIYRGQQIDGPASLYFFGSTSAFDMASGFDAVGEGGSGFVPMAAFKFNSLQLAGNPTIKVPPGGAQNLGLISIGNITSGAPGGTFTFAGMNTVMLATQDGSINLDATTAFANLNRLFLYARGASDIVIGSPMTNMGTVILNAEKSIRVNGNETVSSFQAFTANWLTGNGNIAAANQIRITGTNLLNFSLAQFAPGPLTGQQVLLNGGTVNLNAQTNQDIFKVAQSVTVLAGAGGINITGDNTLQFLPTGQADFESNASITGTTIDFVHPGNGLILNAAGDINVRSIIGGSFINAGGNIMTSGNLTAIQASALGNINVGGTVRVLQINPLANTSNTILTAGAGGIIPFSAAVHDFTVGTVQSPDGINFSGNNFGLGANGAVLNLNVQSQVFAPADGINGANFNGGDADAASNQPGGNGGTFNVTAATGDITVGTPISATTGANGTVPTGGTGGTVTLTANQGSVNIDNQIQVSGRTAGRQSAAGGNINIISHRPTGVAINVSSTGQLLALLDAAAPGPGGTITISADGASSQVNVGGVGAAITADHPANGSSLIDIRQTGASGQIMLTSANLSADIVKVAALGDNGRLTIGGGMISADNILRLYAGESNGQVIFVADCTIRGVNELSIAANTVRIDDGVMVNVTGHIADVYTNNAQYVGGNQPTTGMFTGLGANTHLGQPPPPLRPARAR